MGDIVHVSGLCGPRNPGGHGGWGFSLRDEHGTRILEQSGRVQPEVLITNNTMEFVAVGKAIQAYIESGRPGPLLIRSSSDLVVNTLRGVWAPRKGAYVAMCRSVQTLMTTTTVELAFEHVRGEQNLWVQDMAQSALREIGIVPFNHRDCGV